jgi:hypothetical protein
VSTADFDRPIYAVPDIHLTPAKARFAALLVMRDAAYRAFDRAMAVPRSAIRWAIGLFHRWVEVTGSAGVLSWLGGQARNSASLIREAGIVPSLLAVLSTPPIPAAAAQAARFVGKGIVRVAKATWTGIKSVLNRCGSTGSQIVQSLTHMGAQVSCAGKAVANHPMMQPVIHGLRATLALVRPVSHGFVANRLLAALVPVLWLRAMMAFLVMPFLVDSTVLGTVWEWASTPTDSDPSNDTQGADDAQGDLLISTLGNAIPMPGREVPSDVEQPDAEDADVVEQVNEEPADEDQHLNRAERRAQQRDDKRNQHPRR